MTEEKKKVKDEDLEKVGDALRRAAARAREKARQTGTPLIIFKDGKVIKEKVT